MKSPQDKADRLYKAKEENVGHDEKHYPCESTEREEIKTDKGFRRICKKCGHTFKEIKKVQTLRENF